MIFPDIYTEIIS